MGLGHRVPPHRAGSVNRRTPGQSKAAHALFTAFARHYPGTTKDEWKAALLSLFPAFLAEADGEPIPPPADVESTREMTAERCAELIEFLLWLGTEIGVSFRRDD